jgi:BASS family bile acid:Na+ symporter
MFGAGLSTTFSALGNVFKNIWLVVLVLLTAIVIRPLVGWGTAELLSLETPSYIALLLLAACPGAPMAAKMVMAARGNVVTGASLQVVLAAIGSITFPIVANLMIGGANLGDDISLPVGELIMTVAFLQLVPFAAGIFVRHWAAESAANWNPPVTKVSTYALMIVIALALLGSWRTLIDLIGSMTLLAGIIFPVVMILIGYFLAVGKKGTRIATSLIEPGSNAGPVMAAVAIGFNNDPAILGATVVLIFLQIIVMVFVASWFAKGQPAPDDAPAEVQPAEAQPA